MKTRLFLISALLTLSFFGFAQPTTSLGPKIGVNVTTFRPKAESFDLLSGLNAGLFLNHSINSNFGIMVEGTYSQMGTKVQNGGNMERIHYLQIPVAAVYYFGQRGQAFRPKIFAGPYLGILLAATDRTGSKVANGQPVYTNADVGAQVGLGFNYRIKNETWLNADVRYIRGFGDITREPSTSFQNVGVGINLGISFPIKK
ncbi:porin family protein [Emticicia sp. 17c]|uniref:porin family protein n=1 Tax=Emticicia sp. 17c TaxID=3127704 RepID=UPI00301D610E